MENETKPWYTSKTMWTNFLTFVFSIMVAVGMTMFGDYDLTDPAVVASLITMLLGFVNMILRLVTNKGLE